MEEASESKREGQREQSNVSVEIGGFTEALAKEGGLREEEGDQKTTKEEGEAQQ